MKMLRCLALPVIASCVLLSSQVAADSRQGMHPLQNSRFYGRVGAFYADVDGYYQNHRSDGTSGPKLDYDLLGLDDSQTMPIGEFVWRVTDRLRIQAEYLNISEDNKGAIERDISWGNVDFTAGVAVQTDLDLDIARLLFGYSILKDEVKELGLGIGLHYAEIDISLSGQGSINGTPVASAEEELDEWGAMPNVGVYGNYALSPKWLLEGRADWMDMSYSDYSGDLWHVEAGVQYQAFKHVGIALAYRYLELNIEDDDSWEADIDYTGPILYITGNF